MQSAQNSFRLNQRLIRVITRVTGYGEDDTVESLIAQGTGILIYSFFILIIF